MASIAEAEAIPTPDRTRDRRVIRAWLLFVALFLVAIVVVGGATRLNEAGLSITEWKPIHGVIPPLNDAEWQEEFAKYQQIPEGQLNAGMTLDQFKGIFWLEWAHRLLARLVGFVVLVPLVYFWATGRLESALKPRVLAMLILGGAQGALGWWMVASGLTERTDVSQYRLAAHLTLGCFILAYVVWVARAIAPGTRVTHRPTLRFAGLLIVLATFMQIFMGGLVAGLNAGTAYTTWPLMDGVWIPDGLFIQEPWWRNLFENAATVQFFHRLGAYVLVFLALFHARQAWATPQATGAWLLAGLVLAQAALGIATLIHAVPMQLALLHQFGAVLVLTLAVAHLRAMLPRLGVTG
jgi:cytochrome c oxidase assembly protein subunit 15